jgi:hypothetical protein
MASALAGAEQRMVMLEQQLSASVVARQADAERFHSALAAMDRRMAGMDAAIAEAAAAAAAAERPEPVVVYAPAPVAESEAAPAPADNRPEDQLPAFLRRAAAASGMAATSSRTEPQAGVDVGAVIAAMNDIENGFTQRLDELTQIVNDIAHRLDMPALPLNDDPAHQHIHTIEDWLRSIDSRAAHADQMAAALAAEQERLRAMMAESEAAQARAALESAANPAPMRPESEPVIEPEPEEPAPPLTVEDMRRQALDAVKAAAKAKRDETMGASADDRDVRWRLTEIGLNAGTGHERSINLLDKLADGYAMPADDMRRALIHEHDRGSSIAVSTTVVESTCAMRLADAEEGEIPGIIAKALDELAGIGG